MSLPAGPPAIDAADLSHDLRRTLTLILGHLELLEEDVVQRPELVRRHLRVIEAYSGRLAALASEALEPR